MSCPEETCPIWGTPAAFTSIGRDCDSVFSERIGAGYEISRSAAATLRNNDKFTDNNRVALSQSILEAEINGRRLQIMSDDLLPKSSLLKRRSVIENLNLLMKAVHWRYPVLGQDVYSFHGNTPHIPQSYATAAGWMEAGIGGQTHRYLFELFQAAMRKGWVHIEGAAVYLTLEGFEIVERLAISSQRSSSIFVAMWFGSDETNAFFDKAVRPAIEGAGYRCVRIDQEEHNDRIDEQILAEIRKSKAVLVDITCGLSKPVGNWSSASSVGAPRGGVYFEAGYAAGLDIPIIWTVQQSLADVENVIHFDVRQYNQIRWTDNHDENCLRLRARLEATLGRGDQA